MVNQKARIPRKARGSATPSGCLSPESPPAWKLGPGGPTRALGGLFGVAFEGVFLSNANTLRRIDYRKTLSLRSRKAELPAEGREDGAEKPMLVESGARKLGYVASPPGPPRPAVGVASTGCTSSDGLGRPPRSKSGWGQAADSVTSSVPLDSPRLVSAPAGEPRSQMGGALRGIGIKEFLPTWLWGVPCRGPLDGHHEPHPSRYHPPRMVPPALLAPPQGALTGAFCLLGRA